jgi:hypothetical protein
MDTHMSCRCYRCEATLSRGLGCDILGTMLCTVWVQILMSLVPPKILHRIFLKLVTGSPSPAGWSVPDCERHAELGWKLQLQWPKGILCSVSGYCRSKAFTLVGTNTWQNECNRANVDVVGEIPS